MQRILRCNQLVGRLIAGNRVFRQKCRKIADTAAERTQEEAGDPR